MLQRILYAVLWGGVASLALACAFPWMRVPAGSLTGDLIALTPTAAAFYRILCPGIACTFVIMRMRTGLWGGAVRNLSVVWFMLLLFFPYFSIVCDSRVAAQASWMQMQHENLTWLGGDVCTGSEFNDTASKNRVYAVDPPRRLTVFRMPSTPPWDMELSNLGDLLDWLGYTEAFCQFIQKGWFVALFGAAAVVMATCALDRKTQRVRIIQSIRLMAMVGLVGVSVAWTLPFVVGARVAEAEKLARAGKYELALERLESAARWMSILRHDTSFIAQKGKLGHLLGRDDVETRLYAGTRLESAGRYPEANQLYRSVIRAEPVGAPARREACRALLRDAIQNLNSGRTNVAEEELREILAAEPTNLKANYTLQLAYLRSGQHAEVKPLVDRFNRVYGFFQSPIKEAAQSASHSTHLAASLDANQPGIAWPAYRKMVHP